MSAGGLQGLLGPKLLKGNQEIDTSSLQSAVVALYFSAHWCPPCRGFTPQFAKVYKRCKEQGKSFEVVFVSSDRDEASFREYYGTMPWLALPFSMRAQKEALGSMFGVRGIPCVVLLSGNGSAIDQKANAKVMSPTFPASIPRAMDLEGDVGALPEDPVMVRVRHRGEVLDMELDPADGWEMLRMQIYSATEVPPEQQRLFGLGVQEGPLSEQVPLARAVAAGLKARRGSGFALADVPEGARSASSTHKEDPVGTGHHRGRMDSPQAWSAKAEDKEPWYQMDLGASKRVAGVTLAGRGDNPIQWVTKLKVSVAAAEAGPWQPVDGGAEFAGIPTGVCSRRVVFAQAVEARFVRVHPTEFKRHCSLRADVLLAGSEPDLPPEIVVLGNFSEGDPFEVYGDGAAAPQDTGAKMVEEQHLAMLQAKLSSLPPKLQNQVGSFQHVLKYEDLALQRQALDQIPVCALDALATAKGTCSKESGGYEISFMRQLLRWFKHCFFTWTNAPPCEHCGSTKTKSIGGAQPNQVEASFGAGHVEVAQCDMCGGHTRFPRYNDPGKLLETRTGRCGEWANCFTLVCRSLGYEARHVHDWTDHVWTEIYSDSWGRWVHADSCEAAVDCALMYEKGWGKKLTYCIAFGRDNVSDASRRYTRNWEAMLGRRKNFSEQELKRAMAAIDEFAAERSLARLGGNAEPRRKLLEKRAEQEEKELASCISEGGALKEGEQVGRTSGDKEWREQRGELGSTAEARERAVACSVSGVGGGGAAAPPVPGSWWGSAQNASLVDGVLSADLRCCDGSMRRCSVKVEPGASYSNDNGEFRRENNAHGVPGSWAGSAENATLVDGTLTADLRRCDGSLRRTSIRIQPGASYGNDDGGFKLEAPPPPAAAPAPAATPAAAPAAAGAAASPPAAGSKEDMQARIKAAFAELVASGVPPNEAAAKALQKAKEMSFTPPPRTA